MGNRIGVIFHKNFEEFSPLLYDHYAADSLPRLLQEYLRDYKASHKSQESGHTYNPAHMMADFIGYIADNEPFGNDHIRVENLSPIKIEKLQTVHEYLNCFEGGCWIVNVDFENFGDAIQESGYVLYKNNIVDDELDSKYDY